MNLSVVQAWVGPEGADQDFSFANGWYEIKTIGASADSVSISSLQQLDRSEIGYLIINRVDKCAPEHHGSTSLFQKTAEIREFIKHDAHTAALFEEKLARSGYLDLPEYDSQKYFFSGTKIYKVDKAFPKLITNNVPPQVIAGHYILSIPGLVNWEI
jgi:hypothetical protein